MNLLFGRTIDQAQDPLSEIRVKHLDCALVLHRHLLQHSNAKPLGDGSVFTLVNFQLYDVHYLSDYSVAVEGQVVNALLGASDDRDKGADSVLEAYGLSRHDID